VSLIDRGNRLQNFRMNAGIVIAGKTAEGFHTLNNVAERLFFATSRGEA
jgi:hypothetical protein